MYASHWMWYTWDISSYPFWNHMDGPDESEKNLGGYNINYLSIWPFMCHSCFPTEKVSKVAFFRHIWWKTRMSHKRSNAYKFNAIPQKNQIYLPVHVISKRINRNISCVPHRKFSFFFQWLAYIKYERFLQELKMACVFAIKISIYIVCPTIYIWSQM